MKTVIIGNGIAGLSAASTIRRLNGNAEITLISREPGPAYSACNLGNYLSGDIDRSAVFISSSGYYEKQHIRTLFESVVREIDAERKKLLSDRGELVYDKLIIATGSIPWVPSFGRTLPRGIFSLKTLGDADRIKSHRPRKAVVLGSGPVGIEAAVALKKNGAEVHLVELLDRILPRLFDARPAQLIQGMLEANGIAVHTGRRVTAFLGEPTVQGVSTDQGQIECDTVIVAAGMYPDTRLAMNVDGLSLTPEKGLKVDGRMETSVKDVFACGDCAATREVFTGKVQMNMLWHNAKQQGIVAGQNALGLNREYRGAFTIAGVDVFGRHAVSLGVPGGGIAEDAYETIEKESGSGYYRIVHTDGLVRGAQYIGPYEELGIFFTLIQKRRNVGDLLKMSSNRRSTAANPWAQRVVRYLR
jgi:NADH oxidase (H2O2-forming)